MIVDKLIKNINSWKDNEAIIWNGKVYTYGWLRRRIEYYNDIIVHYEVEPGAVVAIIGDYSPNTTALLLSLIKNRNIAVPLTCIVKSNLQEFLKISTTQYIFKFDENDKFEIVKKEIKKTQKLLKLLQDQEHSGLILFSSGTTGKPKGIVHDFENLLSKFLNANKQFRTLAFLLFDHIAGIDTLFYTLFNGGTLIFPIDRKPSYICYLIEKFQIEVLPTSPTFLNLLLISRDYINYDLKSLKIITFGSETMPDYLPGKLDNIFPNVKIVQKYGVSELGSPSSKTHKGNPTLIKMDSDQFKVKIVDGTLFVKAETAMLGYLNAPSPFTDDGWFNTGDAVEVNGEYMKILGRKSEIINVGGEKVYPQEVENVILEIDNVAEATVYGEKNPIMGNIVCANARLLKSEDKKLFITRLKKYCKEKLQNYKIPVKVKIIEKEQYSSRFKKNRQIQ